MPGQRQVGQRWARAAPAAEPAGARRPHFAACASDNLTPPPSRAPQIDDRAVLVVGANAQRWVTVLSQCGMRGAFPLDPSQGRHADFARGDMREAVRSWIIKRRVSYVHLVVSETKIGLLGSRAVSQQAPSAARIRVLTHLLQLCSEHNVLWSVEARDDLPILL